MLSRYLLLLAAMPLASCFMSAPPLKSATPRSLSPSLNQRPKASFTPQMATAFTYGATVAKPEILQEAAAKFINDKDPKFTPTSGGVNNWVNDPHPSCCIFPWLLCMMFLPVPLHACCIQASPRIYCLQIAMLLLWLYCVAPTLQISNIQEILQVQVRHWEANTMS
jgi:hypothetical protein